MDVKTSACKIVQTLVDAGYVAYFAGGWVRDLLMGHPSSDIDISTEASPEVILSLFPKTIPVGIAFGVVIVVEHGHQFEVSSFRRDIEYSNGRKPDRVEWASAKEDALRRDFTINGMFFDPLKEEIFDFVGGQSDIKKGVIRTIGDPAERFREDRLRMIRAIRFATRFQFKIDTETKKAIQKHASTLFPSVAIERIWQEWEKMSRSRHFDQAIVEMDELGILPIIFPDLKEASSQEIKKRVSCYQNFPSHTPSILFLPPLFPKKSLSSLLQLGEFLKVKNSDLKLLELYYKARELTAKGKESDIVEWIYLYAQKESLLCLEILAANYTPEERLHFLQQHSVRTALFHTQIERMRNKTPVVSATLLQSRGIAPGPIMGKLLKEAEKIAISKQIEDPLKVLEQLKNSSKWP